MQTYPQYKHVRESSDNANRNHTIITSSPEHTINDKLKYTK